uniref:Uncharacterized protein n=1 Tax=Oryza glaberrima TaxID=4538 RepID=I1PZI0_ORYGL
RVRRQPASRTTTNKGIHMDIYTTSHHSTIMAASSVTGSRRLCILFYLLTVVATVVTAASAHTAHNATADEEYWEKRAEEARSFNRAAYVSD